MKFPTVLEAATRSTARRYKRYEEILKINAMDVASTEETKGMCSRRVMGAFSNINKLFLTKRHLLIFIAYMGFFIGQGTGIKICAKFTKKFADIHFLNDYSPGFP